MKRKRQDDILKQTPSVANLFAVMTTTETSGTTTEPQSDAVRNVDIPSGVDVQQQSEASEKSDEFVEIVAPPLPGSPHPIPASSTGTEASAVKKSLFSNDAGE